MLIPTNNYDAAKVLNVSFYKFFRTPTQLLFIKELLIVFIIYCIFNHSMRILLVHRSPLSDQRTRRWQHLTHSDNQCNQAPCGTRTVEGPNQGRINCSKAHDAHKPPGTAEPAKRGPSTAKVLKQQIRQGRKHKLPHTQQRVIDTILLWLIESTSPKEEVSSNSQGPATHKPSCGIQAIICRSFHNPTKQSLEAFPVSTDCRSTI